MPQQLPPRRPRKKKPANLTRSGILVLAAACAAAAVGAGPQTARAIVTTTPPPHAEAIPSSTPTTTPNSTVLPLESSLFFVLDGTLSSKSTAANSLVRAHLRNPIVLAGTTIAPAGAPVEIRVVQSQKAQMGNVDGSLEIYFEPLTLASGAQLPLSTPTSHLDPHISAGRASTRDITDTVEDVIIPYHYLYHVLRKGMDVTLKPGTVIRARTDATLSIARGAIAIATPSPFVTTLDTPHPAFSPSALATPPGFHIPTPKPSPSPSPTPAPASPAPAATPT